MNGDDRIGTKTSTSFESKCPRQWFWIRRFSAAVLVLGFALWMIKPVGDARLTAVAYGLVVAGAILSSLGQRPWLYRRVNWFFLASVAIGLFGAIVGFARGNPGAASEMVFFVVLPAVWAIISSTIDLRSVQIIINSIPFVALLIGLLGLSYWLDAIGVPGFGWAILIDLGQGIGLPGDRAYGYVLTYYPISSLAFILPFLFVSLFVPTTFSWKWSRIVVWPAVASVLFLLFISGRRALFVSLILAVIIGFFTLFLGAAEVKTRRRLYIVGASALVAGVGIMFVSRFSPAAMIGSVMGDMFSSDSVRAKSGSALLESFAKSPIIGNGLGATVGGAVRDKLHPWNFELQYHLVLNALGVVGLLILTAVTLGLLVLGAHTYKSDRLKFTLLAPVTVGAISCLIANATNPYLHTPGSYWMLFLLVIAINAALRYRRTIDQSGLVAAPSQREAIGD